jgi:hypothetical protein
MTHNRAPISAAFPCEVMSTSQLVAANPAFLSKECFPEGSLNVFCQRITLLCVNIFRELATCVLLALGSSPSGRSASWVSKADELSYVSMSNGPWDT